MTLTDILDLREDGWEVRENNAKLWRLKHKDRKGLNIPDINRIILYTSNITTEDDYNVTLMHELYQAHNPNLNETETKELSLYTNAVNPGLVDFAKSVFI